MTEFMSKPSRAETIKKDIDARIDCIHKATEMCRKCHQLFLECSQYGVGHRQIPETHINHVLWKLAYYENQCHRKYHSNNGPVIRSPTFDFGYLCISPSLMHPKAYREVQDKQQTERYELAYYRMD
jgi:hypothetical protein